MVYNTMTIYEGQVAKCYKEPSHEVELKLYSRIQTGDDKARDQLIYGALPFAKRVALQYVGNGVPFEDLVACANLGIVKAAKTFDASKNFKFISYAVWWIRQAILKEISDVGRLYRLPTGVSFLLPNIRSAMEELSHKHGRAATPQEVLDSVQSTITTYKMRPDYIEELMQICDSVLSVDQTKSNDMDVTILDTLGEEDDYDGLEFNNVNDRLFGCLDERETEIIKKAFGYDGYVYSLDEIGRDMGVSRERIRQIRDKALKKMRVRAESIYAD